MNSCPRCEEKGRSIQPITIESHVSADRLTRIGDRDDWRLCTSTDCHVVYFRDDDVVTLDEVETVLFHKSEDPNRLVCFCFEHTVANIESDVEGEISAIQASIKAACKAGLDDCERKNPQGRCCLGNVGQILKQSKRSCCDEAKSEQATKSGRSNAVPSRRLRVTLAGSLVASVLSSACCWLPLAAVALGVSSTVGAAAMIEKWRVPFLVATGVFFSAALYFAYRKTRCSSGSSCDESVKRNERLKHVAVSLVTVLVLTFLFLPEYIGVFAHEREAAVVERPFAQTTELYRIEGMTCVGCEGHVSATLEEIPGVTSVVVSYRNKTAEVRWNKPKNDTAVVKALAAIGYEASRN